MEWAFSIFYILMASFFILKCDFFKTKNIPAYYILAVFGLKILATLLHKWLNENYNFGGDSFTIFNAGRIINGFAYTDFPLFWRTIIGTLSSQDLALNFTDKMLWTQGDVFYNDNRTIIRIDALLYFISGGYYIVHGILFSFLALIGFNGLFKFFNAFSVGKAKVIFAITFLIPATLFWCSGASKESWLIFCLGIFLYTLNKLYLNINFKLLLSCLVALVFMVFIKVYFLLALLPALIAYLLSIKFKSLSSALIYLMVYISSFIVLLNLRFFKFIQYLQFKQVGFQNVAQQSSSQSIITVPEIGNSSFSLLKNMPVALQNIMLRPYLWEANSLLWGIAAVENIIILLVIIVFTIGFKWSRSSAAISLFCLFFSLSIFILIGLTTPVIGALVRYKAPLLPFFIMFFYYNFDFVLFKKRLPFVRYSV